MVLRRLELQLNFILRASSLIGLPGKLIPCMVIIFLLPALPVTGGDPELNDVVRGECEGPVINEIVPDPDTDHNGDGTVDQEDEFIELFNPSETIVDLQGWSVEDNYGDFDLDGCKIQPGSFLLLPRTLTGLRLGRSDRVLLRADNGTSADLFEFESAGDGDCFGRMPDGSSRWSYLPLPTPGEPNPEPPSFVINEVMADPEGANSDQQWAEIVNTGTTWSTEGFRLTNHDSVDIILGDITLISSERLLIHLGETDDVPPVPENTTVQAFDCGRTMYSTGDDLELIDRDGYSLDFIAWGSSTHVDRCTGLGNMGEWSGKYYDEANGTMSQTGSVNPVPKEGRSLSRQPDLFDSHTTTDIGYGPELTGGTPNWNNSMDPDITISSEREIYELEEGETDLIKLTIHRMGNMKGNISIKAGCDDDAWTIERISGNEGKWDELEIARNISVMIKAPADLSSSVGSIIRLTAEWEDLPFIDFEHSLEVCIPFFDCGLEDVRTELDGFEVSEFPEGSFLVLKGRVVCNGALEGGDLCLGAKLAPAVESGQTSMERTMEMDDLKSTSDRRFEFEFDTLGLEGNFTVQLEMDIGDRVKEPDENNNRWSANVTITATKPREGLGSIILSGVLWNTTEDRIGISITNSGNTSEVIGGIRLTDGIGYISFPEGSELGPGETAVAAWGDEAVERFPEAGIVFRCDGEGAVSKRMEEGEEELDLAENGVLHLSTRYRDVLDTVMLRRKCLDRAENNQDIAMFAETTFGTLLQRREDSQGVLVDTDRHYDWQVQPSDARLWSILVDPGPEGPGEFVSLKESEPMADISGLGLIRGGGMITVPNSTFQTGEAVVISDDPDAFTDVQGTTPPLSVSGHHSMGSISCDIPGYSDINLPNTGGKLLLVDRGNRPLDSISWGSGTGIGCPDRGEILGRSTLSGNAWSLTGSGYHRLSPMEYGSVRVSRDPREMIGTLNGTGSDRVKVVTPGIADPWLVSALGIIRESGTHMDIYMTDPPWCRNGMPRNGISMEEEMGYIRHLGDIGARIFSTETGNGEWGPAAIYSRNGFWSFDISYHRHDGHGKRRSTCIGFIPKNGGLDEWVGSVDASIGDIHWFDPSSMIKDVKPVIPEKITGWKDIIHDRDRTNVTAMMTWRVDPHDHINTTGDVSVFHVSGPLDTANLFYLVSEGCNLSLSISDGLLRVLGEDSYKIIEEHRSMLLSGEHRLRLDQLTDDIMERITGLHGLITEISGLEIIRGDRSNSSPRGFNHWTWNGGSAFGFPIPSISGMNCWIICNDTRKNPDVMAKRSFPEFLAGSSQGTMVNSPGPGIIMDRVYHDTYLRDDPDEAVRITNTADEVMDISGFMITDDEGAGRSSDGMIMIPNGTEISGGGSLWIARDAGFFRFQFGYRPDLALYNTTDERIVELLYGDFRLANSNDTISLRDPLGRVVDVIAYGQAMWKDSWHHYAGGSWKGPAVDPPGWGKIIHRWMPWSADHPQDTDEADDWMSPRPMFPGQSSRGPSDVFHVTNMSAGVTPDSGTELLKDALFSATRSIYLNTYQITSNWISSALLGARERGIDVKVIIEGGPVGGTSFSEEIIADRLTRGGIEVRWMMNVIDSDIRDRYRYDHAKYLIVDDVNVIVSTDNMKDSSFPPTLSRASGSTRGWIVSIRSSELANEMKRVFMDDWNGPDMIGNQIDTDESAELFTSHNSKENGTSRFKWNYVTEDAKVRILTCPDHISTPGNPLYTSLCRAKHSIDLELMDISQSFDLQYPLDRSSILKRWGLDPGDVPFNNPYLNILLERAMNGVDVRLLLDGSDFDGDGIPDNKHVSDLIMGHISRTDLDGSFEVRLHPTPRPDIYDGEISLIHNKGAIIDGETVWISSFNWGPNSALENREMGLLIDSTELADIYGKPFEHDWGGTLLNELKHELIYAYFQEKGSGEVSGTFSMRMEWRGNGSLDLLLSTENGSAIGNLCCMEAGNRSVYTVSTDLRDVSFGDRIILSISSGTRTADLYLIDVRENKPDENTVSRESWISFRSRIIPVLLIVIVTLSISISRPIIHNIRERLGNGVGISPTEE